MSDLNIIETSIAAHFIENEILHIIFNHDADIELDDMLESKEARIKLQKGNSMKTFVDIRGIYRISKEAKAAAAEKENSEFSIAMAILTESLATKLIANFFIQFNKPYSPTKMFKKKENAIKWLNSFK
jgi:hypothetical protein